MSIQEFHGTSYRPEDSRALPGVSPAEATVLKLLRQKDLDKVTVFLRAGKILKVEAGGDIAREDLSDRQGKIHLRCESDFETVTVVRHYGKVVKAKRIRPFPFTEKDNRRTVDRDNLFPSDTEEGRK